MEDGENLFHAQCGVYAFFIFYFFCVSLLFVGKSVNKQKKKKAPLPDTSRRATTKPSNCVWMVYKHTKKYILFNFLCEIITFFF